MIGDSVQLSIEFPNPGHNPRKYRIRLNKGTDNKNDDEVPMPTSTQTDVKTYSISEGGTYNFRIDAVDGSGVLNYVSVMLITITVTHASGGLTILKYVGVPKAHFTAIRYIYLS